MTVAEVFQVAGAVIASLGGGSLIVFALSNWLGKVWANRILEQDRRRYSEELERVKSTLEQTRQQLQAQLDKTVHVHRVQFETEFKAMSDLWATMSRLRAAVMSVRPIASIGPLNETSEDKQAALFERINELVKRYNRARIVLDDRSPFFPADVHEAADAAVRVAHRELIDVQTDHHPFESAWFDHGQKYQTDFLKAMDELSVRIRARLRELAVYRTDE